MGFHGLPWGYMGLHGLPWAYMGLDGLTWRATGPKPRQPRSARALTSQPEVSQRSPSNEVKRALEFSRGDMNEVTRTLGFSRGDKGAKRRLAFDS